MVTNLRTPAQRKSISVELLHLGDSGYGPQGLLTREQWRELCVIQLGKGKKEFESWQLMLLQDKSNESESAEFGYQGFDEKNSRIILEKIAKNRCALDFVGLEFAALDLSSCNFYLDTLFNELICDGDTNFVNSHFYKSVNFQGIFFLNDVSFNRTIFEQECDFDRAKFNGMANFDKVVFENGGAFFVSAEFKYQAWFVNCEFNSVAWFSSSVFWDTAWFEDCQFSGAVDFSNVSFRGHCRFDGAIQNGVFKHKGATFRSSATFENAVFENVAHFEFVYFLKQTPSFRGCKIGDTRLEFSDDSYFPKDEKGEDAVKNISFLKRLAEEHGQTEQALNFNAMELRAKAASDDASWNFKIVTWFYKNLSDFGRSFLRPLTVYAIILFITFLIALEHSAFNAPRNYTQNGCEKYVWWIERVTWVGDKNCQRSEKVKEHKLTGIRAAGEYTLYRAVGVLDFADSDKQTIEVANRLFGQDYEPWWMRIYGIFKAIASTALLFLAALGLRNKYRIK